MLSSLSRSYQTSCSFHKAPGGRDLPGAVLQGTVFCGGLHPGGLHPAGRVHADAVHQPDSRCARLTEESQRDENLHPGTAGKWEQQPGTREAERPGGRSDTWTNVAELQR